MQEAHPAISTPHHAAAETWATSAPKINALGCQGDHSDLRTLSTLSLIPMNSASAFSFLFIYFKCCHFLKILFYFFTALTGKGTRDLSLCRALPAAEPQGAGPAPSPWLFLFHRAERLCLPCPCAQLSPLRARAVPTLLPAALLGDPLVLPRSPGGGGSSVDRERASWQGSRERSGTQREPRCPSPQRRGLGSSLGLCLPLCKEGIIPGPSQGGSRGNGVR